MERKKTIWITGAKGYIGSELVARLGKKDEYLVAGTGSELSVTDQERLDAFANEIRPDVIINCAGIARRKADISGRIKAYETNALGARNIAVVANTYDALMVQVSTDDVFPSRMSDPSNEFDVPNPRGAYGKSKLAGEVMVRDTMTEFLIVRSSWVYSAGQGMLKRIFDAAKAGEKTFSRTDMYASPTSIKLYADFIMEAIEKDFRGVFHICSKGVVNRDTFQATALKMCGYNPRDVLEQTQDLVTAEQVLLESMRLEMLGVELPTWEEDLHSYLEEQGLAK